jgi:spore coat protein U-like protein
MFSEAIAMANFTPVSAAIGGALIGLAATLLMLLTGRVAGISGILAGCLDFGAADKSWRIQPDYSALPITCVTNALSVAVNVNFGS